MCSKQALVNMPKLLTSRLVWVPLAIAGLAVAFSASASREQASVVPAPALDELAGARSSEIAVLAGGCSWGVQGVYQHLKGVTSAVSGYAGAERSTADYGQVGSGR